MSFASGMAAVSALFLDRLSSGDHLVLSNVCYAGVAELAHDILPKHGIAVTAVDTSNPDAVAAGMRPNTKLVHIETPANPILRLSDITAIAAITHAGGAELSVDATIATPLSTKPLALGADYVVHSLTKYIGGHGDALGGVVIDRQDRIAMLRKGSLIHFGGSLGGSGGPGGYHRRSGAGDGLRNAGALDPLSYVSLTLGEGPVGALLGSRPKVCSREEQPTFPEGMDRQCMTRTRPLQPTQSFMPMSAA